MVVREAPLTDKRKRDDKSTCSRCGMVKTASMTGWIFTVDRCECESVLAVGQGAGQQTAVIPDEVWPAQNVEQIEHQLGSSPDKFIGSVFDGKYEIVSLLGRGGLSVVYKANHILLKKPVALKLLSQANPGEKITARLQQEAMAASHLDHANVVKVHQFELLNGKIPFLVLEYVDGTSLSELIQDHGPLDYERAVGIVLQVCEALAHAHERGVVHRDLKPSNILICREASSKDFVKIVDFGMARLLWADGAEQTQLTQSGEVFGTPLYMSTEQCQGKEIDWRSDIYSLGCIFYEMLTGSPPFPRENVMQAVLAHIHDEVEPLPDSVAPEPLKHQLQHILTKALEKDRSKRYQLVKELAKDLESLSPDKSPQLERQRKIMTRRSVMTLASISLALVIPMLVAGLWFHHSMQSQMQQENTLRVVNKPVSEEANHDVSRESQLSPIEMGQGETVLIPSASGGTSTITIRNRLPVVTVSTKGTNETAGFELTSPGSITSFSVDSINPKAVEEDPLKTRNFVLLVGDKKSQIGAMTQFLIEGDDHEAGSTTQSIPNGIRFFFNLRKNSQLAHCKIHRLFCACSFDGGGSGTLSNIRINGAVVKKTISGPTSSSLSDFSGIVSVFNND